MIKYVVSFIQNGTDLQLYDVKIKKGSMNFRIILQKCAQLSKLHLH